MTTPELMRVLLHRFEPGASEEERAKWSEVYDTSKLLADGFVTDGRGRGPANIVGVPEAIHIDEVGVWLDVKPLPTFQLAGFAHRLVGGISGRVTKRSLDGSVIRRAIVDGVWLRAPKDLSDG